MNDEQRATTWIVIAAYNEGRVIGAVVRELALGGWHVVVVDDGSRDDTAAEASRHGALVLRHVLNCGQGASLQTGIDFALARGARYIVTFDADGQHDANGIAPLIDALDDADVALGSRHLGGVVGASVTRRALLALATWVSNRLSGLKLTDAHCGLRAFRAEVAGHLRMQQQRMAHASELLRMIGHARLKVVEVPVHIRYTDYSRAKGQGALQAVRILFDYFFRT